MSTPAQVYRAVVRERLKARGALMLATEAEVAQLLASAASEIQLRLVQQPSEYERWLLPQLLQQIEALLEGATQKAASRAEAGLQAAWTQGEDLVDKPLNAALGRNVELLMPALDPQMLKAITGFVGERLKDVGVQALSGIKRELGLVGLGARTPFEALQHIQELLGAPSSHRALRIVRTEMGGASSLAAQARMEQAALVVPGLCKQWRRSGKVHSRWNHDVVDGQVVAVDQPFRLPGAQGGIVKMMHPHDPKAPAEERINCGCLALPVVPGLTGRTPGAKPFTDEEIRQNGAKARLDALARRNGFRSVGSQ